MKNAHTPENPEKDPKDFQNKDNAQKNKGRKSEAPQSSKYDSENLDNETDSSSKDITEQDIEKDLISNDPSEGFETDIGKAQGGEKDSDAFEMTRSDKDNPLNKEFEIGQLGNEELKKDERSRDKTDNDAVHFHKPSERKF